MGRVTDYYSSLMTQNPAYLIEQSSPILRAAQYLHQQHDIEALRTKGKAGPIRLN